MCKESWKLPSDYGNLSGLTLVDLCEMCLEYNQLGHQLYILIWQRRYIYNMDYLSLSMVGFCVDIYEKLVLQ